MQALYSWANDNLDSEDPDIKLLPTSSPSVISDSEFLCLPNIYIIYVFHILFPIVMMVV